MSEEINDSLKIRWRRAVIAIYREQIKILYKHINEMDNEINNFLNKSDEKRIGKIGGNGERNKKS